MSDWSAGAFGPFEARGRLGEGGMGEVWSGDHHAQGVPVAIKVIRRNWVDERVYLDAFAREIRAVASLDHPGIVSVYDHGRAARAITSPWGEVLERGSPYLVMEYVERGSLDELIDVMDWPLTRRVTLGVLDALAHAHARGVVHKDLKPGNVLLTEDAHGEVRVKLTDFGVAHALTPRVASDPARGSVSAGTPAYMPPEQIVGQWRDYGPWTDLYALGCMIWELCTGAPPFDADSLSRLAALHLFTQPPRLHARFEVPDGLERWLLRLLRKNLWERYPTAADAAWALEVLEPSPQPPSTWATIEQKLGARRVLDVQPTRPFEPLEPTAPMDPRVFTVLGWGDAVRELRDQHVVTLDPPTPHDATLPAPLSPTGALPSLRPPWPSDWRRPHRTRAGRPLLGAGLGLYGLREVRLVGRQRERDVLWRTLGEARREGQPRAVLMRGPSGVGKSRLVEWLCVRAQECGGAGTSRASHQPFGGPSQGLERMLRDDLCAHNLTEEDLLKRLLATLEREAPELSKDAATQEAAALASFMHGGRAVDLGPRAPRVRLGSDRERFEVLTRHLARRARHRPLILWLDDVQWGDASLNFALHLLGLERERNLPILLALTVREDLLAERHAEADHLSQLARHPDALDCHVEPLPDADHRALIAELLVFDDALVDQIAQRTRGNPLFATQLIGDWVERGVLEPSDSGFMLRPGSTAQLPDDVHALWRQRVGRLMHDHLPGERSRQGRAALEIAAALGLEVDALEWRAALELARVDPPPELVRLLVTQRLARQTPNGFSFVHGMLRESLERIASDSGDAASHHACCAGALRALYGAHALGHAERVAAHLSAAGRVDEALDPLLDASYQAQLMGHYARAERALSQHDDAARALDLGPDDPRLLRAEAQRAWLDWLRTPPGRGHDHVTTRMDDVESRARHTGVHDVVGECLRWRGLVARFAQDFETSLELLERAHDRFQLANSPEGIARTALSMAVAMRALGRLDEAEIVLVDSIEAADACGLYVLLPRCFGNLAEVSMLRGDWPKARQRFARAAQVASTAGDRKAQAFALTGQGDVAMTYQDWPEAELRYAEAERLFSNLGSHYRHWAHLELACVWVLAGEPDRAEPDLRAFLNHHSGRDIHQDALAHLGLACVSGSRDDWGGFGAHFGAAQNLLARTDASRPVFVQLADHAAELAAGGDHPRLARAAEAFALRQELALDRDEDEEEE